MKTLPLSGILFGVLCTAVSFAAEIEAPKSLQGAIIRFQNELFYPGDISIEQYETKGNTAHVRLWLGQSDTSYYYNYEYNITGTKEADACDKKAKPAVITFTEKNGRILSGKLSGFLSQSYNYKGRTTVESYDLENEHVEVILPKDGEPTMHATEGPQELPSGTVIQIKTDQRTITGEKEKQIASYPFFYAPGKGKTASRLSLFFFPNVNNKNTFYTVSVSDSDPVDGICVTQGKLQMPPLSMPMPYIYFTEKVSDKIHKGTFSGYLHGYTFGKNSKGLPIWKHQFCEKLTNVTIVLP